MVKKAYLGRGFEPRMACNLGWAEAASALGAPRFFPPGPASRAPCAPWQASCASRSLAGPAWLASPVRQRGLVASGDAGFASRRTGFPRRTKLSSARMGRTIPHTPARPHAGLPGSAGPRASPRSSCGRYTDRGPWLAASGGHRGRMTGLVSSMLRCLGWARCCIRLGDAWGRSRQQRPRYAISRLQRPGAICADMYSQTGHLQHHWYPGSIGSPLPHLPRCVLPLA